ncbi:Hypothetical predicted protein [Mytilus galloprovincialis]|uniref:Reverse transcriptase RNase H-like domain-containing protein n=1 Tax=Mytilus galloprovincialis TaxID=29158 RepID=A0A8B6G191_MYTGA|nr:Hypothetical predicted protein [Mytilus galloprovincialis]
MDYQKKLPTLLHHRGNQLPNNNTGHIAKDGCHFARLQRERRPLIPLEPNLNEDLGSPRIVRDFDERSEISLQVDRREGRDLLGLISDHEESDTQSVSSHFLDKNSNSKKTDRFSKYLNSSVQNISTVDENSSGNINTICNNVNKVDRLAKNFKDDLPGDNSDESVGLILDDSQVKILSYSWRTQHPERLVNFVGRFIPNLATVAEPLHRLLHKETKFQWGPEQNDSFEKLKKGLVDASDLSYFSLKAKTQVIADASPVGLGAVLVQKQNDEYKVICYASRSLTTIERKYSQTEKEALGLVWACERFHMYLLGHDFELLTDHRPLEFIFSPKSKPCARVERWMLRMQPFKYVVKYIPGSQNIADSLSRLLVVPKNCIASREHFPIEISVSVQATSTFFYLYNF